jgi:hypothetical protein
VQHGDPAMVSARAKAANPRMPTTFGKLGHLL